MESLKLKLEGTKRWRSLPSILLVARAISRNSMNWILRSHLVPITSLYFIQSCMATSLSLQIFTDGLSISTASIFVKMSKGRIPIVGFGGAISLWYFVSDARNSWETDGCLFLCWWTGCCQLQKSSDRNDQEFLWRRQGELYAPFIAPLFWQSTVFPSYIHSADLAFSYATQYEHGSATIWGEFYREEPDYRLWMWDDVNDDELYAAAIEKVF